MFRNLRRAAETFQGVVATMSGSVLGLFGGIPEEICILSSDVPEENFGFCKYALKNAAVS